VIDRLDTVMACVESTIAVVNDGIVCPTIPKSFANLYVLLGENITVSMRDLFVDIKIKANVGSPTRDNIPTDAAFADVVKRRKLPGEIEGLGVCG
jgi:hypothetical protein